MTGLVLEAMVAAGLAAAGASVLAIALPGMASSLKVALSGLTGVILTSLTSVLVLSLGQANNLGFVVGAWVAVLVASLVMRRSRLVETVAVVAGSALAAGLATLAIGSLVGPILTFDSWRFLEHGSSVFGDGSAVERLLRETLGNYPVSVVTLQGLTRSLGGDFLSSGMAAIGVLGVAGSFALLRGGEEGWRGHLRVGAAFAVVTGVAVSAYSTRLQLGYVNSHALTAGFYSVGVAAIFADLPHRGSRAQTLPAALLGISCLGLALSRVEGLVVVALMLVAAVVVHGWSRRSLWIIGLVGLVVPLAWYGRLSTTLVISDILTPARTLMLVAVATAPLVVALVSRPGRPVRWLGAATLLGLGAVLAVVLVANPTTARTTVSHLVLNLASMGLWGAIWWVALPLAAMAIWELRDSTARPGWLLVTLGYVLIVLILGGIREFPYAARWGDSGNRMMVHVLPAFFMMIWVGIGSAGNTRSGSRNRETAASGEAPTLQATTEEALP